MFTEFSIKRFVLATCGLLILCYALVVLLFVQVVPDLGLRTFFSNELRRRPVLFEDGPKKEFAVGDRILSIGNSPTTGRKDWSKVLHAPHDMQDQIGPHLNALKRRLQDGERVQVPADLPPYFKIRRQVGHGWEDLPPGAEITDEEPSVWVRLEMEHPGETPTTYTAWSCLGLVPIGELVPSLLWFFLKATLLFVGAWVWWKKPDEPAVQQFYVMTLVTVGAYIGGYHWSLLLSQPLLLLVFIVCGPLLPAVNLHFYSIFPQPKSWMVRWPKTSLAVIYGVPLIFTAAMLTLFVAIRWGNLSDEDDSVAREALRHIAFVFLGVAALWYVGSVAALLQSFVTVTERTERNQVKTILVGASLALAPICYSLWLVLIEPDKFADGWATWPMFAASAILTIAYAVSITRYRLMDLDKLLFSSMDYFVASFVAAALYYAVVFVGAMLFNRYIGSPRFSEAATFSGLVLLTLLVLDQARGRVRKFLDRRFAKQKTQLDRTLQRMGQAIEQLVDPHALAMKFLNATADLLGASQGAVFLRQGDPAFYKLAGFQGSAPSIGELPPGSPLVDALQHGKAIDGRHKPYLPLTSAQKQLKNLGGELAQPIMHEDRLLAFVVLGPKEPPYRAEDAELLAAFAQITGLALQSAEGHRTIEQLNQELRGKVQKISEQQRRIMALQSQLHRQVAPAKVESEQPTPEAETEATPQSATGIVGASSELQHLLAMVRKVAATDAVVLLRGESGTGKELIAKAVHEASPRADKAFVKVHCAALAPTLLESELFGHVKGAFTGASKDKIGRFEMANGGTLFLDEIGDISLDVQTKLLRVLQEQTFERVGSSDPIQVDVRIVTATHQNLEALIRQSRFREDLFYRLNVFPVLVPPLRQRVDDIPELALHFMKQVAAKCKKDIAGIDDDAMELLKTFPWPGNVRQLENVIERAVVIAEGSSIGVAELPAEMFQFADEESMNAFDIADLESTVTRPLTPLRRERLRMERDELVRAMAAARGNKAEAARALGIARSTLVSRLKKFGLV